MYADNISGGEISYFVCNNLFRGFVLDLANCHASGTCPAQISAAICFLANSFTLLSFSTFSH